MGNLLHLDRHNMWHYDSMVYGPWNASLAGETMHQPLYPPVSIAPNGGTKVNKSSRNNLAIYGDSISLIPDNELSMVLHANLSQKQNYLSTGTNSKKILNYIT